MSKCSADEQSLSLFTRASRRVPQPTSALDDDSEDDGFSGSLGEVLRAELADQRGEASRERADPEAVIVDSLGPAGPVARLRPGAGAPFFTKVDSRRRDPPKRPSRRPPDVPSATSADDATAEDTDDDEAEGLAQQEEDDRELDELPTRPPPPPVGVRVGLKGYLKAARSIMGSQDESMGKIVGHVSHIRTTSSPSPTATTSSTASEGCVTPVTSDPGFSREDTAMFQKQYMLQELLELTEKTSGLLSLFSSALESNRAKFLSDPEMRHLRNLTFPKAIDRKVIVELRWFVECLKVLHFGSIGVPDVDVVRGTGTAGDPVAIRSIPKQKQKQKRSETEAPFVQLVDSLQSVMRVRPAESSVEDVKVAIRLFVALTAWNRFCHTTAHAYRRCEDELDRKIGLAQHLRRNSVKDASRVVLGKIREKWGRIQGPIIDKLREVRECREQGRKLAVLLEGAGADASLPKRVREWVEKVLRDSARFVTSIQEMKRFYRFVTKMNDIVDWSHVEPQEGSDIIAQADELQKLKTEKRDKDAENNRIFVLRMNLETVRGNLANLDEWHQKSRVMREKKKEDSDYVVFFAALRLRVVTRIAALEAKTKELEEARLKADLEELTTTHEWLYGSLGGLKLDAAFLKQFGIEFREELGDIVLGVDRDNEERNLLALCRKGNEIVRKHAEASKFAKQISDGMEELHEAVVVPLRDDEEKPLTELRAKILAEMEVPRADCALTSDFLFKYQLKSNLLKVLSYVQDRIHKLQKVDIRDWRKKCRRRAAFDTFIGGKKPLERLIRVPKKLDTLTTLVLELEQEAVRLCRGVYDAIGEIHWMLENEKAARFDWPEDIRGILEAVLLERTGNYRLVIEELKKSRHQLFTGWIRVQVKKKLEVRYVGSMRYGLEADPFAKGSALDEPDGKPIVGTLVPVKDGGIGAEYLRNETVRGPFYRDQRHCPSPEERFSRFHPGNLRHVLNTPLFWRGKEVIIARYLELRKEELGDDLPR